MCIVCQCQTVSGQVCVLSVSIRQGCVFVRIRQFLDRYVNCLSISDSFGTSFKFYFMSQVYNVNNMRK